MSYGCRQVVGLVGVAACGIVFGCGRVENFPNTHNDSHNGQAVAAITPVPVAALEAEPQAEEFSLLEGYVSGAFAVTVDGVPYDDMEDFYTVERQNLPARVARSGYDATWNVRLDAAIGFQDLWHDMIIYMSPLAGSGFQGQARVGENGYFALKVPARGRDHDYRVRANKRIGIVLTRGEETRRICYNFSAVEQQVPLHADTLPIALEHFETSITTYDCVEVQDAGLDVPQGNG